MSEDRQEYAGRYESRWVEINLYRTGGGRYVVAITYRTLCDREAERNTVRVTEDLDGVAEILQNHKPIPPGIGYPSGPEFEVEQAGLVATLWHMYEDRASDVLLHFGELERLK